MQIVRCAQECIVILEKNEELEEKYIIMMVLWVLSLTFLLLS